MEIIYSYDIYSFMNSFSNNSLEKNPCSICLEWLLNALELFITIKFTMILIREGLWKVIM